MKTYNTPAIEISKFERINTIACSITVDPDTKHDQVGAPSRYDDDDDF